jgi:GNAT superfamily N-acetyltransferase
MHHSNKLDHFEIVNIREFNCDSILKFDCTPLIDSSFYSSTIEYNMINDFLRDSNSAKFLSQNNVLQTSLVIDPATNRVIAFFSLCCGSRTVFKAFKKHKKVPTIGRNAELPTIELIWFGVSRDYQNKSLGTRLIFRIFEIAMSISEVVGACLLIVDSLPNTRGYYEKFGFLDLGIPHKKMRIFF